MKRFKKLLSAFLVLSLILVGSVPIYANDVEEQNYTSDNDVYLEDYINEEDKQFLNKLKTIYEHVELENQELVLNLDENELVEKYNFKQNDLDRLNEILDFSYPSQNVADKSILGLDELNVNDLNIDQSVNPYIYVKDWKIHFTSADVQDYFLAASQIGPAAIILALQGLGSVLPGAGNVVAAVVGLIGAGTIYYYVVQALTLNRGMYIGISWNVPFPVPAIGLE